MTQKKGRGGPVVTAWAGIRGALWPIPCLGIVLAVIAGVLLPELDGGWAESGTDPLGFVFGGGASAARDLLAAIAGSLISVTGLTFSLTVVALQLSSSQYSPRLLQTFVTDRFVQMTLAQLVMTFVYALTVLRTVRTESATEDDSAFVPRLSITIAYALTLGSVMALVLFLGHLARTLRVETMLRDVHDEATRTIEQELGDGDGEEDGDEDGEDGEDGRPAIDDLAWPFSSPASAVPLMARSSGFLVGLGEERAVSMAQDADVVIRLRPRMGDAVIEGTPVAHVWPARPGGSIDVTELEKALDRVLRFDFERSADRDVAYGLRKIIDIVVRALSPGINDPTTAVHALSHASALLGELAARSAVDRVVRDDDEKVRVVLPAWTLPSLIQVALEEPLLFAEGQPTVLRRLASLLRELAWHSRGRGLDGLLSDYVERVAAVAVRTAEVSEAEGRDWRAQVERALTGGWPVD